MLVEALFAAAWLAAAGSAQTPGSIVPVGTTTVSAMMMFLGNEEKVYILDKAEANPTKIGTHPAWGAVWDIASHTSLALEVESNTFCASGFHLPNGSFATFGGNADVIPGPGGAPQNYNGAGVDSIYDDEDGRKSIRIMNPCTGNASTWGVECQWYDNPGVLSMMKARWYSTAEALEDGTIVMIGGMVKGGFINREWPIVDPLTQQGHAENTYEYFPRKPGYTPTTMDFLINAGGLSTYPLAFLMPSGRMFLQANVSTMLWDPATNDEIALPPMPNGVVRVYPASGGAAMLPLTPENSYNPTIIFCGGFSAFTQDSDWGNYSFPFLNPWDYDSSNDCQRITPEPLDGSAPEYVADDLLPVGRTMGQFIYLPTGKMVFINGGGKGMAAYANNTLVTPEGQMPFGWSLATDPQYTPVIYDPEAPAGTRWSSAGLGASKIPRLYHSSALLMPDGSVMIAGSNPNPDYYSTGIYPTTYEAEIFYPPYWGKTRPVPQTPPTKLTYGGTYFNVTLDPTSIVGDPAEAAGNSTCVVVRPGFTTHGMNMGQRFMQLNNTYTVDETGQITLHCSQPPPVPAVLQPGPVLFFVVTNGVPSLGKMVIVGSGNVETQPTAVQQPLPVVHIAVATSGSGSGTSAAASGAGSPSGSHTTLIIAAGGAAVALLVAIGVAYWFYSRKRREAEAAPFVPEKPVRPQRGTTLGPYAGAGAFARDSDSTLGYNSTHALDKYGAGPRRDSETTLNAPWAGADKYAKYGGGYNESSANLTAFQQPSPYGGLHGAEESTATLYAPQRARTASPRPSNEYYGGQMQTPRSPEQRTRSPAQRGEFSPQSAGHAYPQPQQQQQHAYPPQPLYPSQQQQQQQQRMLQQQQQQQRMQQYQEQQQRMQQYQEQQQRMQQYQEQQQRMQQYQEQQQRMQQYQEQQQRMQQYQEQQQRMQQHQQQQAGYGPVAQGYGDYAQPHARSGSGGSNGSGGRAYTASPSPLRQYDEYDQYNRR